MKAKVFVGEDGLPDVKLEEWPIEVTKNGVIRKLSKKRADKWRDSFKTVIRNEAAPAVTKEKA